MYTHPLPLSLPSTSIPLSRSSQNTRLSSLCWRSFLLAVYFTYGRVYISATFSACPTLPSTLCPQGCFLCLCLYSCHASMFIQYHFSRFHICVLIYICFSLSDLIHCVRRTLGSSTSLQMTHFLSFLWLSNIPLCICTTSSLSIYLLIDPEVASVSWLL